MTRIRLGTGMAAVLGVALAVVSSPAPAQAITQTATVTVSASIASTGTLALKRDTNSVTRFSPTQVVFDRVDSQDPGVTGPSANFMYAPYRSETGKNWHLADINSNGTSLTLSADVTGTIGGQPLASHLSVFCGGFFASGASTPVPGTKSADWESLDAFSRTVNQAFTGIVPFNYRLDITGIPAGTYSGTITYTLIST